MAALGRCLDDVGLLHGHDGEQLVADAGVGGDGGEREARPAAQKHGLGPLGGQVFVVGRGQAQRQVQLVQRRHRAPRRQRRRHVGRQTALRRFLLDLLTHRRRRRRRVLRLTLCDAGTLVHGQPLLDVRQRGLAGGELGQGVGRGRVLHGPGGLVVVLRTPALRLVPGAGQLAGLQGSGFVPLAVRGAAALLAADDAAGALPRGDGAWRLQQRGSGVTVFLLTLHRWGDAFVGGTF